MCKIKIIEPVPRLHGQWEASEVNTLHHVLYGKKTHAEHVSSTLPITSSGEWWHWVLISTAIRSPALAALPSPRMYLSIFSAADLGSKLLKGWTGFISLSVLSRENRLFTLNVTKQEMLSIQYPSGKPEVYGTWQNRPGRRPTRKAHASTEASLTWDEVIRPFLFSEGFSLSLPALLLELHL